MGFGSAAFDRSGTAPRRMTGAAPRRAAHRPPSGVAPEAGQARSLQATAAGDTGAGWGSIFSLPLDDLTILSVAGHDHFRQPRQGSHARAWHTWEMPELVQSSDPCRDPTVKARPRPALECGPSLLYYLQPAACNLREGERER